MIKKNLVSKCSALVVLLIAVGIFSNGIISKANFVYSSASGGVIAPFGSTTFYSPTHGQKFAPGQNLIFSGTQTVTVCTSFSPNLPSGCEPVLPSVSECSVEYHVIPVGNTLLVSHLSTYKGNFVRTPTTVTCNFDTAVPLPANLAPGDYIAYMYVMWESVDSSGRSAGTNYGAVGEHITIDPNAVLDDNPHVFFNAVRYLIAKGTHTTLNWTSVNVDTCTASDGWSGSKATAGTEQTQNLNAKTTFTLSCSGPNGSVTRSLVIDVQDPPTADIKADGSDGPISKVKGSAVNISWTASNADLCTISGFIAGGSASGYPGSRNDTLNTPKTQNKYFINCASSVGTAGDNVVVNITPPKPDYTASQLQKASGNLVAGSPITFSASINNIGQGNANSASTAHFEVDGVALSPDASVGSLAAGNSQTVTSGSWTAVQGNHTVRVCADSGAVINESDETNNCTSGGGDLTISVSGPPAPDLTVTTPQYTGVLVEGNTLTLSTTVKNEGNANATHATPIQTRFQIDLNNATFQTADLTVSANDITTTLTASGQQVVFGSWANIPTGTHAVRVCTDTSNVVAESNESNNCSGNSAGVQPDFVVTIGTKPDLTPLGTPTISGTLDFNQPLTFGATIKNQGGSTASNFNNRFYIDLGNDNIGSINLGNGAFADVSVALNPNTTMTLTAGNQSAITSTTWSTSTPGTNRVIVCADTANVINESNESNNCSGTANMLGNTDGVFSVGRKADLFISIAPTLNSGTLNEGFDTTFKATIKNQGQVATPSGFTSRFYIDLNNDGTLDVPLSPDPASAPLSNLAPNDTTMVISGTWNAVQGKHRVVVCADVPNTIPETDETNNCSNATGGTTQGTGIITVSQFQQF